VTRFEARCYDGHSSRATPVELCFHADGRVTISGEAIAWELTVTEIEPGSRLAGAPRRIGLPTGASLEVADSDALERCLAPALSQGAGWVARLEAHWLAVALCLGATILCLGLLVWAGIPTLARIVARSLPAAVEQQLGEQVLETLDGQFFAASESDADQQARAQMLFDRVYGRLEDQPGPRTAARLVLRSGGALGANAFALPSGIVVVSDELLERLEDDAELAAVFAHELGHVRHRHGLRMLLQNVGVGVLVAGVFGDFISISSLAATLPAMLLQLQYSRHFETEADEFAVALLERSDLPPQALARALDHLTSSRADDPVAPAYLSTHPATADRVKQIEDRSGP
jgi:Zn-dependent protease with chaperone function